MNKLRFYSYSKLCRYVAGVSFLGGLLLVILYFITDSSILLYAGLIYFGLAFAVNAFFFKRFVILSVQNRYYSGFWQTILLMLGNIPIGCVCFLLAFKMIGVLLLTTKNETDKAVEDFRIDCYNLKPVSQIRPHQSKTIIIKLKGDCEGEVMCMYGGKERINSIGYWSGMSGMFTLVIDQ